VALITGNVIVFARTILLQRLRELAIAFDFLSCQCTQIFQGWLEIAACVGLTVVLMVIFLGPTCFLVVGLKSLFIFIAAVSPYEPVDKAKKIGSAATPRKVRRAQCLLEQRRQKKLRRRASRRLREMLSEHGAMFVWAYRLRVHALLSRALSCLLGFVTMRNLYVFYQSAVLWMAPGCHMVLGVIVCHWLSAFGMELFQHMRKWGDFVVCAMIFRLGFTAKSIAGRSRREIEGANRSACCTSE
jgi:hypothetical protein